MPEHLIRSNETRVKATLAFLYAQVEENRDRFIPIGEIPNTDHMKRGTLDRQELYELRVPWGRWKRTVESFAGRSKKAGQYDREPVLVTAYSTGDHLDLLASRAALSCINKGVDQILAEARKKLSGERT